MQAVLLSGIEQNFETEKVLQELPWKPWKPFTIMAREKKIGHYSRAPMVTDKILQWTGVLKRNTKVRVAEDTDSVMFICYNDTPYAPTVNQERWSL